MLKPPLDPDGLFEVPLPPPVVMPTEKVWGGIATWTRYKGRHTPCDICTRVIHDLGIATAPAPKSATWRRKGPNDTKVVCSEHHAVMSQQDQQAKHEHDERVATSQHMARASNGRGLRSRTPSM